MYPSLFLGAPVMVTTWNAVSPGMQRLFGSYLETQQDGHVVYVGRSIEGATDLETLDLVRTHLHSVLRKMLPPATPLIFSCRAYLREEPPAVDEPKSVHGLSYR